MTISPFPHIIPLFLFLWHAAAVKGDGGGNSPLLLYSTSNDIRILNTTRNNNSTVLVANITEPAIDFHYEHRKICWVDRHAATINCAKHDNFRIHEVQVVTGAVPEAAGLACDWFTNKLYWVDKALKKVEVATMDGAHRKVLFWKDIDQPRAIAIAPMKGLLFWTDWGETPKIERAGMDGDPSTRTIIISQDLSWPNGLTLDLEKERLYLLDAKLLFIDSMTFDGKERTSILRSTVQYSFSLSIYKTKLFWTDWKAWTIYQFDMNTTESRELIDSDRYAPTDLKVYDKIRQPREGFPNPCEFRNGGCSTLCLLSPKPGGYSCGCSMGIKLLDNQTCAKGPHEMLILATRSKVGIVYLDSPDFFYKTLPLNINYSVSVDYDPVEDYIYWTDSENSRIERARLIQNSGTPASGLSDSVIEEVVEVDIKAPDGIAVDWISRNLYWTDADTKLVEVCRLSPKKYRKVIAWGQLENPRAIAVAPQLGWLFWSDWGKSNPKIERANLDGSQRRILVVDDIYWPNGIALDVANFKIFWSDAHSDKIEYSDMNGENRIILISDNVPHVFGFTLLGDFLYWTDWQKRTIERAHKNTGDQRTTILDQMPNVMGLKAIQMGNTTGWNPCSDSNGDCSQLCFYKHDKSYVCACEILYELAADQKTCVKPDSFLLFARNTSIGIIGTENEGNQQVLPITNLEHVSSLDFETNSMRIYWSDSQGRKIMRALFNGSNPQELFRFGLQAPEGIAVDWLGLNIYWADPVAQKIEVARLTGTSRKTLFWGGKVFEPHSVAVDPPQGYMYWSEWGIAKCIKKAAMDGSNHRPLISTKGFASDLSLDYERRRLYWREIGTNQIVSSDLDGNGEKVVFYREDVRPVGLSQWGGWIFFNDNVTGVVYRAGKYSNGSDLHRIDQVPDGNVTDMMFYHRKSTGSNQCAKSNGGCKHLCLALPAKKFIRHTCACPTHYSMKNKQCTLASQFMIYSQKNSIVRVLPSPNDSLEVVLPIKNLNKIKAIGFDPVDNILYYIEGKSQWIKRVDVNNPDIPTTIHVGEEVKIFDLVVDTLGRLLFWTCENRTVINVTRLDNNIPLGVVVNEPSDNPRLLAIHQTKRLLVYTVAGTTHQLVRVRLDGSHRVALKRDDNITAIAVDPENDWVIWAEGKRIYASNIDLENMHVLVNESHTKIAQLTVLSGWLYWIGDREPNLQSVELIGGEFSTPLALQASNIVDLISVTQPNQSHPCFYKNRKDCSHLCILNGTTSPQCACPVGHVLSNDRKTCAPSVRCTSDQFECGSSLHEKRECIPKSWRCDRQKDCEDGSDELECPTCLDTHFKCHSGECISRSLKCDGVDHCSDKSDEFCCRDVFKCATKDDCIPLELICNDIDNCADGSDEDKGMCASRSAQNDGSNSLWIQIVSVISGVFVIACLGFYCFVRKYLNNDDDVREQSDDSLSPMQPKPSYLKSAHKIRATKGIPDVVRMSMIKNSDSSSYDRSHITGASSSTNGSTLIYPREPLNPPPSPATTRGSSPSSRYRPYRHYRAINQPPPPTPCSTDVCDESDYNYPVTARGRYDGGGFFPPPPTPRSHCHSESCPPSPSSRSSTYFSPLPPPPSPVAREYPDFDR